MTRRDKEFKEAIATVIELYDDLRIEHDRYKNALERIVSSERKYGDGIYPSGSWKIAKDALERII